MRIEVLFKSGQFYIHGLDNGHTRPASREEVRDLCGDGFMLSAMVCPGWLSFDSTDGARAEAVGFPQLNPIEVQPMKLDSDLWPEDSFFETGT